jgi:hypothetical protein
MWEIGGFPNSILLMIRKVYEVDPLRCPKCCGTMKLIAFMGS